MRRIFIRSFCIVCVLLAAASFFCGAARVLPRGTSIGGVDVSR